MAKLILIPFSSIVEANGKTIRENNMEKTHGIPLGALVEVKYDTWFGNGACEKVHARLWVVVCGRDCDGTPIYWLSDHRYEDWAAMTKVERMIYCSQHGGFTEDNLKVIEVTADLIYGTGALEWGEGERKWD